jgi:carbonic anhydrase/acetyltransferase-like protein (isoleucine patch superfamily)
MIQSVDGKTPDKPVTAYVHPSAFVIGDVNAGQRQQRVAGAVVRGDIAHIDIGKNTNIQDGCVLHTGKFKLSIGDGVTVGHRAVLHSCEIGGGTLIGSGAIVLDAAVVGEDCVVAAGTVIPGGKVIPPGSFVIGNPAQITRDATPDEVGHTAEICSKYETLAKTYVRTGVMR